MIDRIAIIESDYIRVKRCRHGLMAYNVHDTFVGRHLHTYGEFHEDQGALFRQLVRPGQVVIDVGAYIGGHTIPMAQHVGSSGRVYALEPQRLSFAILCSNIALNALMNVWPLWAAAGHPSEGSDLVVVPVLDPTRETNFGGLTLGSATEGDSVPIIALDTLQLAACQFVNIDVEGMEFEVVRGATAMLSRLRPALYIENNREDRSAALMAALQKAQQIYEQSFGVKSPSMSVPMKRSGRI